MKLIFLACLTFMSLLVLGSVVGVGAEVYHILIKKSQIPNDAFNYKPDTSATAKDYTISQMGAYPTKPTDKSIYFQSTRYLESGNTNYFTLHVTPKDTDEFKLWQELDAKGYIIMVGSYGIVDRYNPRTKRTEKYPDAHKIKGYPKDFWHISPTGTKIN